MARLPPVSIQSGVRLRPHQTSLRILVVTFRRQCYMEEGLTLVDEAGEEREWVMTGFDLAIEFGCLSTFGLPSGNCNMWSLTWMIDHVLCAGRNNLGEFAGAAAIALCWITTPCMKCIQEFVEVPCLSLESATTTVLFEIT